jgi:hypothetical protein
VLQFDRKLCVQPYLVQFSRVGNERLLWFSCAFPLTLAFNIVTYNLDTRETIERVNQQQLGESNGSGQLWKVAADGRLYFTKYRDVTRPHTLYRINPAAPLGYETVFVGQSAERAQHGGAS